MKAEYQTQCETVLKHMRLCHETGITAMEAVIFYKIMRLSSRINDLKKRGYNIKTTMVQHGNKRYARYTLA